MEYKQMVPYFSVSLTAKLCLKYTKILGKFDFVHCLPLFLFLSS